MNWYSIFYWITVADGVKRFFDYFSNIFTAFSIIFIVITLFAYVFHQDNKNKQSEESNATDHYWLTFFRRTAIWMTVLAFITWGGYVFIPTKKDALLIVAGGAVGEFIVKDTSVQQLPTEAVMLLRTKIRTEIEELQNPLPTLTDTLASKSKEELIKLLKQKN